MSKKMLKRMSVLLIMFLFVFSFVGCSNNTENSEKENVLENNISSLDETGETEENIKEHDIDKNTTTTDKEDGNSEKSENKETDDEVNQEVNQEVNEEVNEEANEEADEYIDEDREISKDVFNYAKELLQKETIDKEDLRKIETLKTNNSDFNYTGVSLMTNLKHVEIWTLGTNRNLLEELKDLKSLDYLHLNDGEINMKNFDFNLKTIEVVELSNLTIDGKVFEDVQINLLSIYNSKAKSNDILDLSYINVSEEFQLIKMDVSNVNFDYSKNKTLKRLYFREITQFQKNKLKNIVSELENFEVFMLDVTNQPMQSFKDIFKNNKDLEVYLFADEASKLFNDKKTYFKELETALEDELEIIEFDSYKKRTE